MRLELLGAVVALTSGIVAEDLSRHVDVFTGTGSVGHTHPAACVPFGMVQAGPDTGQGDWAYCSGYQFGDAHVYGYSLTHLSGTGCADYGDVSVLPFTGELGKLPWARPIDKKSERGRPGYYRVVQPEDGVEVEVAAAKRAAVYRFTWRKGGQAKVLVNLPFGQNCPSTYGADVKVLPGNRIAGSYMRRGWIRPRRLAFDFAFDRKWSALEELPKAKRDEAPRYVLTFDVAPGEQTCLKAGLSMTGAEGAAANLAAEIPAWSWDLDAVRTAARDSWNALFARAVVEGDDLLKKNWYTGFYHLYSQPNDWADADGRYVAGDGKTRVSRDGRYFTTLSLWDTFRAAHPLYTVVTPEIVTPVVNTLLAHFEAEGRLPVLSYGGKNVDCMIGNHAIPVIVDAYLKGFRGFDAERAYTAVTNTLTVKHPDNPKENWDLYDRYGYYPCDVIRGESVSRTMECSYDDWCASVFAQALGKADGAAFFAKRAAYWKNVFDPSIKFGRGKTTKGTWRTPFDPYAFGHGNDRDNDFTEGNAFQYTWHVLQDPEGLVAAMGGKAEFTKRLDSLFTSPDTLPDTSNGQNCDITGLIGQYVHGNEPSHHVIYFYPYVGEPRKAARRIRDVFDRFYFPGPTGLCGNDDCGQMSAWYIFSALGFYPFNPCGGDYVLGAPQLPKAVLDVGGGKTFTVVARNFSKENLYVKSVTLNGRPLDGFILKHADVVKGGELVFEMGR